MDLEREIRYQMLPGSNGQHQEVSPERLLLKDFYPRSTTERMGSWSYDSGGMYLILEKVQQCIRIILTPLHNTSFPLETNKYQEGNYPAIHTTHSIH